TASALAAGCPVVVKGHSAHPGTGEIIAEAILAAITACNLPPAVFSLIQGGRRDVGTALVTNPFIKAVGFTGSLAGGRALFDLCAQRPEPIPFFGELGSVNPMFILPGAMSARGAGIAAGWAGSLTMGAGQFCTNPGIAVVMEDQAAALGQATAAALQGVGAQVMLTEGIAHAYAQGRDRIAAGTGVRALLTQSCDRRQALPQLFIVKGADWLADHTLSEEVFGPLGLIVTAQDPEEMLQIAQSLEGQLTATLHLDDGDADLARRLLPVLERKAGRVLANGFPTGVEVCEAMVHGGPYPASTNFGATSVGTMAIRRWLRPVSYQNIPTELLDEELA
ncbi:MAG: 2,5-dioxovalerate dehydrogenase, partial [Rhodobacteraceae bacterium GWF1_65_7]